MRRRNLTAVYSAGLMDRPRADSRGAKDTTLEEPVRSAKRPSLVAMAVLAALTVGAGGRSRSVESQLAFGVDMAQRGLWQEALFRFQQARQAEGGSARVLNNVAVAYEALGRFEEALETYREALAVAPGDSGLKRNYSQFLEFYQGYQSAPAEEAAAEGASPIEPAEEDG